MNDPSARSEPAPDDLRWLRALAARLVRDPHLADDAVQDTLVAALERAPGSGAPRGWLAAILRNALRQEWRARGRRRGREEAAARPERVVAEDLGAQEELALHRRLVERVDALDEPYRTVIVLHFLRGESVREIALAQSIPEKTVRTRLERALARLRERMGRDREAWLVALAPPSPTPAAAAPLAPALLVSMNVFKLLAAACGLVLVGVYWYSRPREGPEPSGGAAHVAAASAQAPAAARDGERELPDAAREPAAEAREAGPAERNTAAPVAEPVLVRGYVRTLDGRGLEGAEVVFEPEASAALGAPSAPSAADGAFTLPLPSGRGRLGLRPAEHVAVARPQLDGTPPLAEAIVVAAPRRTYAGTVVAPDGAPIEGAVVELTLEGSFLQSLDVGGTPVHLLLPFAHDACDAAGRFRLDDAGFVESAVLLASADGHEPASVALPAESDERIEIVLAPSSTSARTLFGEVVDAEGAPVAGAQVSLGGDSVSSDAAGRFALECETWRKRGILRAVQRGFLPDELVVDEIEGASSPDAPLVLRLGDAPRSIRGRVLDAAGEPVAGALVWTPDLTPFGNVIVPSGERQMLGQGYLETVLAGAAEPWRGSLQVRTDADGRFELGPLVARDYALFALDPRTLDSAGPVDVPAGEERAELVLPRAPLRAVAGRVVSRSGAPLSGVKVTPGRSFGWRAEAERWDGFPLVPPGASCLAPDAAVETDAEGRFQLAPLVADGAYLALRGGAMVLGDTFALEGAGDVATLEVRVDAASLFRLVLADAEEADSFGILDERGEVTPMFVDVEGATISTGDVTIDRGRSGVVTVGEGRHVLVLRAGGTEVRRVEMEFPAGGLHELRP